MRNGVSRNKCVPNREIGNEGAQLNRDRVARPVKTKKPVDDRREPALHRLESNRDQSARDDPGNCLLRGLPEAVNDPRFVEIVGRHFDLYTVSHGQADEPLAHPARDVGEDLVFVGQLYTEHGSSEHGDDFTVGFNGSFSRHE